MAKEAYIGGCYRREGRWEKRIKADVAGKECEVGCYREGE
jgi:hypothetical protein